MFAFRSTTNGLKTFKFSGLQFFNSHYMELVQINDTEKSKLKSLVSCDGEHLHIVEFTQTNRFILESPPNEVLLLFGRAGEWTLSFPGINYERKLPEGKYFLIFHPTKPMQFSISASNGANGLIVSLPVQRLHDLLLSGKDEVITVDIEMFQKQIYQEEEIPPGISVVLDQCFFFKDQLLTKSLYFEAKHMEIISLCFNKKEETAYKKCPFLNEDSNRQLIAEAKKVLLEKFQSPPTIKELARVVGINESNLKAGFKQMYGKPVHTFLNHYKMDQAKRLLIDEQMQVKEVALALGFSNPSHFIDNFRKRFGVTPKRYLGIQQAHLEN